jgi:hypothetical protein
MLTYITKEERFIRFKNESSVTVVIPVMPRTSNIDMLKPVSGCEPIFADVDAKFRDIAKEDRWDGDSNPNVIVAKKRVACGYRVAPGGEIDVNECIALGRRGSQPGERRSSILEDLTLCSECKDPEKSVETLALDRDGRTVTVKSHAPHARLIPISEEDRDRVAAAPGAPQPKLNKPSLTGPEEEKLKAEMMAKMMPQLLAELQKSNGIVQAPKAGK